MRNRLVHVPEETFRRYMRFPERHPDIVRWDHMLQKLIIFDFVLPLVLRYPHGKILEIGCGLGIHSCLLSEWGEVATTELAAPGNFVGADRDVGRNRGVVFRELARVDIPFRLNDGKTIPFPDDSFDIVFHNSVIEHVPDVLDFNREVRRVLKRNGVCICITGTSTLCWFRLVKDGVLRWPLRFAEGVYKEFLHPARRPGVVERLRRGLKDGAAGGRAVSPGAADMRKLFPRLHNYLASPEYNAIVLENMAKSMGLTEDELLSLLLEHFEASTLERVRFYLSPRTHGQHYRDVWEEKREWDVGRWIDKYRGSGFSVLEIVPYRYHHLLEFTCSTRLDTLMYYAFLRRIHGWNARGGSNPAFASEFILVAKTH